MVSCLAVALAELIVFLPSKIGPDLHTDLERARAPARGTSTNPPSDHRAPSSLGDPPARRLSLLATMPI
jgi:hypothetical protein